MTDQTLMAMVHNLEDKVAEYKQAIETKTQSEEKLIEYADAINAQNKRIEALSNKLQTYITRECVLTEVSRYVRNKGNADLIVSFHLALMRAYNLSDSFWEQRNASMFSTEEWYEKIMLVPIDHDVDHRQMDLFKAWLG
jgi:hypothetical protein